MGGKVYRIISSWAKNPEANSRYIEPIDKLAFRSLEFLKYIQKPSNHQNLEEFETIVIVEIKSTLAG